MRYQLPYYITLHLMGHLPFFFFLLLFQTLLAHLFPYKVVIELSGVADPAAVRFNLAQGGVETARVVTLVDANAFPKLYHSWVRLQTM
jgi:G3E family GTPase